MRFLRTGLTSVVYRPERCCLERIGSFAGYCAVRQQVKEAEWQEDIAVSSVAWCNLLSAS